MLVQDSGHSAAKPLSLLTAQFIKVKGADNQQVQECSAAIGSNNKPSSVRYDPDRDAVRQFSGALPYRATSLNVRPLLASHEAWALSADNLLHGRAYAVATAAKSKNYLEEEKIVYCRDIIPHK
ncbi:hypothetical protein B4923_06285 [Brenneria roseae subsp. americana]|uniref:Uncharacterized protein n=2 Tax=Brenneria roseae TaxID=1509241 RepID=A0A2U1TVX8_9GAMM|nr:hypothetical protein B4923_06285 [Brenneria roseae subsp. americana]